MAVLPTIALIRPRALAVVAAFSLLLNAVARPAAAPGGWQAVSTEAARTDDLATSETAQATLMQSSARVVLMPESVIQRWNAATELFWQETISRLRNENTVAIIGAGISLPGGDGFQNTALILDGGRPRSFLQRIPVPIGMWRPWHASGVPLGLANPGTLVIAGERAAILICYEQLLVWPYLQSAAEHPTLMAGMANHYWLRGTPIPTAQRVCLKAWARLFGLPLLLAEKK